MSSEDIQGQIHALADALSAFIATFPKDKRSEFHAKLRQLGRSPVSPGYSQVNSEIIQRSR